MIIVIHRIVKLKIAITFMSVSYLS